MRAVAPTGRALRRGLAVALVVVAVAAACGGGSGDDPAARPERIDDTTPDGVVAGFVAAEAADAYDLSFGALSAAERETIGSVEEWRDLHADSWPLAGGEVAGTSEEGDRATVEVRMRFRSRLDDALGLIPARGNGRWLAVREGDRWRVALDELTVEAVYPDAGDAPGRVVEWARVRQECQPGRQFTGELAGAADLAEQLCRKEGAVEAGAPGALEEADVERLEPAFGSEVVDWAKVVPLTSPAGPLRVVVAPIDDRWSVVGVLAPR